VIILKREDAVGLAYSFFREPNVAHFKTRYGDTDSDNSLTYSNSKAVGITVTQLPSVQHTLLKCVSDRLNENRWYSGYDMSHINSYCQKFSQRHLDLFITYTTPA